MEREPTVQQRNGTFAGAVGSDVTVTAAADMAPRTERPGRWALIDVVRGLAIVAVVVFHLVWDLGHFGITEQWTHTPSGRLTGHVIAGTFLFLTGFSLVLAQRHPFDWNSYGRRLIKLAACAYAITAVSFVVAPEWVVTFGILHDIALTSVLLLPFLRLNRSVAIGAAMICFALPALVSIDSTSRWLTWTGLTPQLSPSLDVQPLLPLFGVSLLGLALAKSLQGAPRIAARVAAWSPSDPVSRTLNVWGRHTLVIYLLHQVVMFGGLQVLREMGVV